MKSYLDFPSLIFIRDGTTSAFMVPVRFQHRISMRWRTPGCSSIDIMSVRSAHRPEALWWPANIPFILECSTA